MQLENLNDKQKQAVMKTEGAVLVLAGAGSGKTKVITNKIAYLIDEKKVKPYNILAITFTNKAAREMKERVQKLIGDDSNKVWISTFHAFCTRILRYEAKHLRYDNNFTIYDTTDKTTLIKACMNTLGINQETLKVQTVAAEISKAKDTMTSPELYSRQYTGYRYEKIYKIYNMYQEELKKNNAMDFDDLIYNTIELFQNFPEVLQKYQEKFEYIMVDEYQDTNYSQYLLIRMLSKIHKNICVVGDDDQSIYAWRGADIRNILEFENDFEDVLSIKLEQNYRSTSNILNAAYSVIKNNENRKNKKIWTSTEDGEKIRVFEAYNEKSESDYIAKEIKKSVQNSEFSYRDFAILYRANALSRNLEEALVKYEIPYKIFGGLKFYDRKEIKDIVAYLRIIDNGSDDVSLKRIINVPKRGIGAKTVEKIEDYARQNSISMVEAMQDIDNIIGSGKAKESIKKFIIMLQSLRAFAKVLNVSELLEKVLSSTNYISALKEEKTPDALSRIENIQELKSVMEEFEKNSEEKSLQDFLQNATLSTDMDESMQDDNFVTLMTIHSAKGLEFPVVFISALEESIFPSSRSALEEDKLEEERRLCYVAITRAKQRLYITRARQRMLYGRTHVNPESRFISEIDENLIETVNDNITKSYTKPVNPKSDKVKYSLHELYIQKYKNINSKKKNDSQEITIGAKVNHKTFGKGMVVGKTDGKYTVVFDKKGIKTIDTSIVKLEIIEQ